MSGPSGKQRPSPRLEGRGRWPRSDPPRRSTAPARVGAPGRPAPDRSPVRPDRSARWPARERPGPRLERLRTQPRVAAARPAPVARPQPVPTVQPRLERPRPQPVPRSAPLAQPGLGTRPERTGAGRPGLGSRPSRHRRGQNEPRPNASPENERRRGRIDLQISRGIGPQRVGPTQPALPFSFHRKPMHSTPPAGYTIPRRRSMLRPA